MCLEFGISLSPKGQGGLRVLGSEEECPPPSALCHIGLFTTWYLPSQDEDSGTSSALGLQPAGVSQRLVPKSCGERELGSIQLALNTMSFVLMRK